MKRGFTLIELLIVTVVIATLMGIVFRLAGVGGDSRKKAITIDRLQRIENALSGYYAAYGSYPPVPLQGRSRDIFQKVDMYGVQDTSTSSGGSFPGGSSAWAVWNKDTGGGSTFGKQILAACKAQPLAVYFPFGEWEDEDVTEILQMCKQVDSSSPNFRFLQSSSAPKGKDWRTCSLFQFGLLSFLLPRYLFMLRGESDFYDGFRYDRAGQAQVQEQWNEHNQLPCKISTGERYENWNEIRKALGQASRGGMQNRRDANMVSNLTSQSVCARWMPNFKGIVSGGRIFYGVDTMDGDRPYRCADWKAMEIHSSSGYTGGGNGSNLYLLDGMTIRDGWGNDFFYYSEPPYQSYKLWSAGPNGQTFPAWYDRGKLASDQLKVVREWTADDISGLNN